MSNHYIGVAHFHELFLLSLVE